MNIHTKLAIALFMLISTVLPYPLYAASELDDQMRSFIGRVGVYSKCLRRSCSAEEHTAAAHTLWKDGRNLLLAVSSLLVAGTLAIKYRSSLYSLSNKDKQPVTPPSKIIPANIYAHTLRIATTPLVKKEELKEALAADTDVLSYAIMHRDEQGVIMDAQKKGLREGYKVHYKIEKKDNNKNYLEVTAYYTTQPQATSFMGTLTQLIQEKYYPNFTTRLTLSHVTKVKKNKGKANE